MSYDLEVWCVKPFTDATQLPSAEKWTVGEGYWSFEGQNWLINTGSSDRVLPEDIPEQVVGQLPGIQYMVTVSLEPLGAPKAGYSMLRRFAKAVAEAAHGVILDPQADTVEVPRGTKRYVSPMREKEVRFGILEMSWWMTNDRLAQDIHLEAFLSLLEKYLPEALPRRYGLHEPPQHVYAETGRGHLKAFLAERIADEPVWYATPPVAAWSFGIAPHCGWRKHGASDQYHCNYVSASFDTAALQQPGWPQALHRLWRQISDLVQPFFGDVRTLNGYGGRLPQIWADIETESHPVRGCWWKGVPPKLGHAIVVGDPYVGLWPGLHTGPTDRAGLIFATTDDWSTGTDLSDSLQVPTNIAQAFMPYLKTERRGTSMHYPETYPEQFPFGLLPAGVETTTPK